MRRNCLSCGVSFYQHHADEELCPECRGVEEELMDRRGEDWMDELMEECEAVADQWREVLCA